MCACTCVHVCVRVSLYVCLCVCVHACVSWETSENGMQATSYYLRQDQVRWMLAKAEAGLSASPVTGSICSRLWWRFHYEGCILLCRHALESYWDNLLQRNSGYCSGETALFPYGFTLLEVRSKNSFLMREGGFLQADSLGFLCSIYFLSFRVDWRTSDRILVLPCMLLVNCLAFHSLTTQGRLQPSSGVCQA